MKQFHEVAVVKRGNELMVFFVEDVYKNDYNWTFIDYSSFAMLCKSNKVKFLTFKNNGIAVEYTDEEKREIHKDTKKAEYIISQVSGSWKQYLSNDSTFKYEHIRHVLKATNVCGVYALSLACTLNAPVVGVLYAILGVADAESVSLLVESAQKIYPGLYRENKTLFRYGKTNFRILVTQEIFESLFTGKITLINTSLLRRSVEFVNNTKKVLQFNQFLRAISRSDALEMLKFFDGVSHSSEKLIGLC